MGIVIVGHDIEIDRSLARLGCDTSVQSRAAPLLVPREDLAGPARERRERADIEGLRALLVEAHRSESDQQRLRRAVCRQGCGPATVVLVVDYARGPALAAAHAAVSRFVVSRVPAFM
jgi:hypothetical protein